MEIKAPFVDEGSSVVIAPDGKSLVIHFKVYAQYRVGTMCNLASVPEIATLTPDNPLASTYMSDFGGLANALGIITATGEARVYGGSVGDRVLGRKHITCDITIAAPDPVVIDPPPVEG